MANRIRETKPTEPMQSLTFPVCSIQFKARARKTNLCAARSKRRRDLRNQANASTEHTKDQDARQPAKPQEPRAHTYRTLHFSFMYDGGMAPPPPGRRLTPRCKHDARAYLARPFDGRSLPEKTPRKLYRKPVLVLLARAPAQPKIKIKQKRDETKKAM